MDKKLFFIIIGAAVTVFAVSMIWFSTGSAQGTEPQFLFTWKAQSYAPSNYRGRVFPSGGSQVTASFELFENGKKADVSAETVYWYLDDNLISGGEGLKTISFRMASGGSNHSLRIQIPNYKDEGRIIGKAIPLPSKDPEAVIEAPIPDLENPSLPLRVWGRPYFFNVESPQNLTFAWEVNGETPVNTDNPDFLEIGIAGARPEILRIDLNIQDPARPLEDANKSLILTLSP